MATRSPVGAKQKQPKRAGIVALDIPAPLNIQEVPSSYVNNVEVLGMNHVDVRIAFNEILVEKGVVTEVKRRSNLVMSVPTFLNMVQILIANANSLKEAHLQSAESDRLHIDTQIKKAETATLPSK